MQQFSTGQCPYAPTLGSNQIDTYLIQHYPQTSINPLFYQQYCHNHQYWLDVLFKAYNIRQK